jgi:hypothetical protein
MGASSSWRVPSDGFHHSLVSVRSHRSGILVPWRCAFLIALFLIAHQGFTQCPKYWSRLDTVFLLVEQNDLHGALATYSSIDAGLIDPRSKVSLCLDVYAKNDSAWFKALLTDLVTNHGFVNNAETAGYLFANDITEGRYREWYRQLEITGSRVFRRTHASRTSVMDSLVVLHASDQTRRAIYRTVLDEHKADSIIMINDARNFERLLSLCRTHGLPNGYDDQYNATGIVELILLHCAKNPDGYQERWDAIMPYIDDAFLAGKGDNGFAYYFDMTLQYHKGMQYYGTLPANIPILDPEGLAVRRAKYCLK